MRSCDIFNKYRKKYPYKNVEGDTRSYEEKMDAIWVPGGGGWRGLKNGV